MFKTLFKRPKKAAFPAPAPQTPLAVIGDVHGRMDLLEKALAAAGNAQIVLVGDYVDRGEQSAQVLGLLTALPDIICLAGNHEAMMLSFLEEPERNGKRWLRYGGLQTLASFGVGGVTELSGGDEMREARDRLAVEMGADLIEWLAQLPTSWQSGNVAVVHAGADPDLPIAAQDPNMLKWGHPEFHSKTRADGVWIVHGHNIVDDPIAANGRIAVDIGAYATGRLAMALIDDTDVDFKIFI